jgi:hypothetical protein
MGTAEPVVLANLTDVPSWSANVWGLRDVSNAGWRRWGRTRTGDHSGQGRPWMRAWRLAGPCGGRQERRRMEGDRSD